MKVLDLQCQHGHAPRIPTRKQAGDIAFLNDLLNQRFDAAAMALCFGGGMLDLNQQMEQRRARAQQSGHRLGASGARQQAQVELGQPQLVVTRLGEPDVALALYDDEVRSEASTVAQNLVDASALLWRLYLRGVERGEPAMVSTLQQRPWAA